MAKRTPREQSLFDNMDAGGGDNGRDATIRSTLLSGGGKKRRDRGQGTRDRKQRD